MPEHDMFDFEKAEKPQIKDELKQFKENENVLYELTPEQIEEYLEFTALHNSIKTLVNKAKKIEKIYDAKGVLFWHGITESSERAEIVDKTDGLKLTIRRDGEKPVIVSAPHSKSGGLPDFLKDLLGG